MPNKPRISAEIAERQWSHVRNLEREKSRHAAEARDIADAIEYLDYSLEHSITSARRGIASRQAVVQIEQFRERKQWLAAKAASADDDPRTAA